MEGVHLRLFALEGQRHKRILLYEWLLEEAKRLGLEGGAAFREIAGYGRRNRLHEQTFFELAGDLPIEIVFATSEKKANMFLEHLESEKIPLFYIKSRAEFGRIGEPEAGELSPNPPNPSLTVSGASGG
jgi:PII-like signaling protein